MSSKWMIALALVAALYAATSVLAEGQLARQGVRVSGTAIDAYPRVTPAPAFVTLLREFGAVGFPRPPRRVDVPQDRSFSFDDVLPGTYRLTTNLGSELVVHVGVEDVANLELHHLGLTELFPSVRMDDGSDVPERVRFQVEMEEGQVLAGGIHPDWPILLPPGRRFFFVQPPDGIYVSTMFSAGVDLFGERLRIDPGDPERGIHIELTRVPARASALARVRGRVTGGARPLAVQLTPTMPPLRKMESALVPVAPDGSFDIELEPGIYDVHVPPAFRVLRGLPVPRAGTTIDVSLPTGRLFGGAAVRIVDPQGQSLPFAIGPVSLVATGAAGVSRFPVEVPGFWGALPPGEYRLTVENLPADVSIVRFEAGGRNLLEQPYVVSADRNPPRLTLVLHYSGPIPSWVQQPSQGVPSIFTPPNSRR